MNQAIAEPRSDRGSHRPLPKHLPSEPRPFAFGPLYDMIVPVPGPTKVVSGAVSRCDGDVAKVALKLGVDRQVVYRGFSEGLGAYTADGLAIRMGMHPVEIWPDWYTWLPSEDEIEMSEARAMGQVAVNRIVNRRRRNARRSTAA
jgi:hypothetical protein